MTPAELEARLLVLNIEIDELKRQLDDDTLLTDHELMKRIRFLTWLTAMR